MSRTACARSAAISGLGSPTAHTSMSAAMPSAWPGTSKAPWSRSSPPRRAYDRRGDRLCRRPEEIRALSAGRVLMPRVVRGLRRSQRAPRMEPLARLPIFLGLDGKRGVVAGGGPAVTWKAEWLSAAGADVAVFARFPCEDLHALAAQPPRGTIVL